MTLAVGFPAPDFPLSIDLVVVLPLGLVRLAALPFADRVFVAARVRADLTFRVALRFFADFAFLADFVFLADADLVFIFPLLQKIAALSGWAVHAGV